MENESLADLADRLERLARIAAGELRSEEPLRTDCYSALMDLQECLEEALDATDGETPDHVLAAGSGGCLP